MCTLINQHLTELAKKFPAVKFLRSISSSCIPNFPDKNLPAIFIYYEKDLKGQLVGTTKLGGMELTQNGKAIQHTLQMSNFNKCM
jgi:hypothetical protein